MIHYFHNFLGEHSSRDLRKKGFVELLLSLSVVANSPFVPIMMSNNVHKKWICFCVSFPLWIFY